ncbi:expressed unknown protein [Seminavis robusta]|uniref:DUF6824 domain-containing protein n=1 Tax=Seminavis robusta TaxID=568900 RepID=A0A9N8EG06_9STRA|nr:expressed unknown protein [Seminavis robusta]|eukprot:Sro1133_g244860.1 n/a (388) ;mRNA; f:28827-29990
MVPLSALQFDEQLAGKPTKAAPKTAAPAADAPEKKTTQKACGSCGSTMAPTGAKFCPGCGCRLTQANPPVAAKAAAEEKPAEDRAQATKENVQKRAAAKAKPATKAKQAGGNVPSSAEVFYDAGALLDHETATGDKGAAESGVAEEMHGAFRGTDSNGALLQRAFRSTDSNGTTLSQLMASTGSFDVFKTDVPVDQSTEVSRKRKANNDIASAGVPRWATEYGIAARSVSPQPEPTPNKKSKTKTNPAPAGNTTSKRADPADEDKNHVEPTERDILLGRGGKSNFWPGNKDYRQELEKVKSSYNDPSLKQREKTKMSRAFVQAMISSGRRFLKKDGKGWFEITKEAARLKVAQALREENTEKSREDKRERFPPKKYYKTCPGPRKSS